MASTIDMEAWRELYSKMGKKWCDPTSGASSTTSSVVVLTQTDEPSCCCDEEMPQSAAEDDEKMGSESEEEEEEDVSSRCVEVGSTAADVGDLSALEEFEGVVVVEDKKRKAAEIIPTNVRYKMTCVSKPGSQQFAPRWTNCSRSSETSSRRPPNAATPSTGA